MELRSFKSAIGVLVGGLSLIGIARCGADPAAATPETSYIYVASGNTFGGTGVTLSTPANTVSRFTSDGVFVDVIRDYSDTDSFAGDTPAAIADYDSDYLLVAVENATTTSVRRIEKVAKDGSSAGNFLINTAAFNAANMVIKDFVFSSDGGFLVSKGTTSPNAVIEKFNSAKARITIAANAYVRAPGGSCATTQTQFSRIAAGPSGTIIGAHAAATTNNKVVLISSNGYTVVGDCLAAVTGPTVNHIPTALLYHTASGKLFVAYGSSTGPVNDIYSYDVTASSISNPFLAYSNISLVQGISTLAEDADGNIYVASANSTFNTVEKFTYDTATGTLTRVGTTPIISASIYTRSISGLLVD